jgi:hypothetical protein
MFLENKNVFLLTPQRIARFESNMAKAREQNGTPNFGSCGPKEPSRPTQPAAFITLQARFSHVTIAFPRDYTRSKEFVDVRT